MPRKEAKLGSFERLLRRPVTLDDHEWAFAVPDLPAAAKLNASGLVKAVSLATKGTDQSITLKLAAMEENRAIKGQPLDRFILLSLSEFRAPRSPVPETGGTRPTTPRECTEYAVRMLRAGITVQGVHYNFFGHSNSQLKSRTCLLYAAPKGDISLMVESLGDFSKMKTVGKKAKRIGLLFSTAKAALAVEPGRCEDIPDIELRDYVFTDGCGLVAPRFAQELARRLRLTFRNTRYSPSVFQIRYRGYKGVVTVDPTMRQGPTILKFRKSMKKFSGGSDLSFAVVEYSKVGGDPVGHARPHGPADCCGALQFWPSERRGRRPPERLGCARCHFAKKATRALGLSAASRTRPPPGISLPVLCQQARAGRGRAFGVSRRCPAAGGIARQQRIREDAEQARRTALPHSGSKITAPLRRL